MQIRSAIGLLLALTLFVSGSAFSQISSGGQPASFSKDLTSSVDSKIMPLVDVEALLAEDAAESKDVPYRFGNPFDVNYDLKNSGTWDVLENGDRLWRLRIMSRDAYSINLIYDRFVIPEGASFFVYNDDKDYVLGGFTHKNVQSTGDFATAPVRGDVIVLEYREPADAEFEGEIVVGRVVHAYKDVFGFGEKGFGDAGSCNNNVHCPEAVDWQDDVRASVMIINGSGSRICSGSMVNNVRQDLTPYFLTANHCLGGTYSTWVFVFNYESPNCTNIDGPLNQTVVGATLRANASASDFGLLELFSIPPESYNVFYGGWNAVDTAAHGVVGIHHPSGDIKKISWEFDPVTSSAYLGLPNSGTSHWRVEVWDDGTTEPGSSGSPIYDNDHRVVGQLHGGWAACNFDTADYYGKISRSWADGASAASRLKDWLDPDNTGALVLDGRNAQGVSIAHLPLPNTTDTTNDYEVIAEITATADPLATTDLHYDVGAGYVVVGMTATGNPDEFNAFIPAQSPGTIINYFITASDTGGEVDTNGVHTFRVLDYGVDLTPVAAQGTGAVDDTVWYPLTLKNTGIFDDSYTLSAAGNAWTTTIYDETGLIPVSTTGTLSTNDTVALLVAVIIPSSFYGDADTAMVTATSVASPGLSAVSEIITISAGEPIAIPFYDPFPINTINIGLWVESDGVTVSDLGIGEPSAQFSANLDGDPSGGDLLVSQAIDLSSYSQDVALTYYYQQGGGGEAPDAGDDLFIEYLDNTATWQLVKQHLGADPEMTTFEEVVFYLPPNAYHSAFRIRFRNIGTSGAFDDWFVDNVLVDVTFPPDIDVSPGSFTEFMNQGDSVDRTLDILNTGLGSLNWTANVVLQQKSNAAFERLKALNEVQPASYEYPDEYSSFVDGKDVLDTRTGYPVEKNGGGPDAFGYFWVDSDEPGGPTFVWNDVSATGTDIVGSLTDDSFSGPYDMGMTFPFYGNTYDQIYVGSNGIIGFTSTTLNTLSNVAIPTAATPNNFIAWMWDDLNPADASSGAHIYLDTTGGKCTIQFTDIAEYQSGGGGDKITAQVVMEADGTITINYLSIDAGFDLLSNTIGIENADGTDGLQVAFNTAYPTNNLAVKFFAPYQWLSIDKLGGSIAATSSDQVILTMTTADLDSGTYTANVVLSSNDPDENPMIVPVEVNINTGPSYVCGDVNNNGEGPNLTDLSYLVNHLFSSGPPPPIVNAADVNASGSLNLTDVTLLVNHLFVTFDPINCP